MEARAFGSGPRTHWRRPRLGPADWLVLAAAGGAVGLFVLARALGQAVDWFPYPTLVWPDVGPLPVAACLLLLVPVVPWSRRSTA
jgi:hypothetical protein